MLRENYGFSRFTSLNQNRRVSRTGIGLVRSVNFQHPSGNDNALNTCTWRDGLLGRTLVVGDNPIVGLQERKRRGDTRLVKSET